MRIGELAEAAGVSTRTVRHYHQVGVLPEPARTTGGYRDYELPDLIRLVHARRLVELGLGLSEVARILDAEEEKDLSEVLDAIDADLAEQERVLAARRRQLAQLRERWHDEVAVGDLGHETVAEFRRAARAAGATGPAFELDHQVLELLPAAEAEVWVRPVLELIRDPQQAQKLVEIYTRFDEIDEDWTAAEAAELIDLIKEIWPVDLQERLRDLLPTDVYSAPVLQATFEAMTPPQRAAASEMIAAFMKRD